jgi:type III pantothenate kinase
MSVPERILAIDCGNTRLKWGVHDGTRWLAQGLLDYAELGGLAELLRAQPRAARAVVCNVAGAEVGDAVMAGLTSLGVPVVLAKSQSVQHGVRNLYDAPEQLGADRWAALIGARALHGAACLVVCAGTATTVDVLDVEGNFQGGLILPGVALMCRALAAGTAQLPLAEGRFAGLPRNTMDAIVSGCLHAQAGAVERMFEQVAAYPGAVCLVSGGAAAQFFELLRVPKQRVDNLVLEGLVRMG